MASIILTNVARDDLPRPAHHKSPDVYPFYDDRLANKYNQLTRPSTQRISAIAPLRGVYPTALSHCWATVTLTDFAGPNQWPFAHTTAIERNPSAYPTDRGLLDAEDLGDEVVSLLRDTRAPPTVASASTAAATIVNTASQQVQPHVSTTFVPRHLGPPGPPPLAIAHAEWSAAAAPLPPFFAHPPSQAPLGPPPPASAADYFFLARPPLHIPLGSPPLGPPRPTSAADYFFPAQLPLRIPLGSPPLSFQHSDVPMDVDQPTVAPSNIEAPVPMDVDAAPATDTSPTANASTTASVQKPAITNTRTKKVRLYLPTNLNRLLRFWRSCTRKIKNEAIRLVNEASKLNHPHLNTYALYRRLANDDCDFSKKHRFLKKCPSYARRRVILAAITARKTLITRHLNVPFSQRRPIPDISPCSQEEDSRRGFAIFFDNTAGKIIVSRDAPDGPILKMTLEVMPTLVNHLCRDKKENSSSKAEIRHRGKSGRESLLGICQQKSPYLYQLPKEFSVCVDSVGHWYLVASHPLTDEAQFNAKAEERKAGRTDLDGPIKVLSGDPGARTFLALYSSDGQTIGIVSEQDRQRLDRLQQKAQEVQSLEAQRKEPSRRGGSRRKKHRRRRRRRNKIPPPTPPDSSRRSHRPTKQPREPRQKPQGPRQLNSTQRRYLRKHFRRINSKMRNLVREIYCRTAYFLALSSDVIIVPRMEVHNMVRSRRPSRRTKQELLRWSHGAFLDRLTIKCHDVQFDARYPHKTAAATLLVQPEGYTSKTCSNCGQLHQSLGSSKRFLCPTCCYSADRDHNGAFNMIIKAIRWHSPRRSGTATLDSNAHRQLHAIFQPRLVHLFSTLFRLCFNFVPTLFQLCIDTVPTFSFLCRYLVTTSFFYAI